MSHDGDARRVEPDATKGIRMSTSPQRRFPWSGDSPRATVVFAGTVLGVLYAALTPVHLLMLTGTTRIVMASVAAASAVTAAVLATATHRGAVPAERLPLTLAVLAALPLVNSLTHTGVAHELQQTAVTMLSIVAVAALARARIAVLCITVTLAIWVVLVVTEDLGPPDAVRHYGVGLLLAVLLAWAVHEILARTGRRLRSVGEDLDAVTAVARCGTSGADPRPVVLSGVRKLAAANSVAWVEPDGKYLVAVLTDGVDATGARVPIESPSATARCWATRTRIFVSDTRTSTRVDAALVALTGSVSMLCEPVVHDGVMLAVLTVGWTRQVTDLEDHAVTVVSTLAAEAGSAVAATRLRAQLEALATTDPMTDLANRRGWHQRVNDLAALSARNGQPLTLAMADLDHFKAYNDTHGHQAGDALLQEFARVATALLRDVDVVARWGGEEFAIALPGSDATAAVKALDRLRASVPTGQTCSFGIAAWDGVETVSACLARADAALYRAKAAGRDRVAF